MIKTFGRTIDLWYASKVTPWRRGNVLIVANVKPPTRLRWVEKEISRRTQSPDGVIIEVKAN